MLTPIQTRKLEIVYASKGAGGFQPRFECRALAALRREGLVTAYAGRFNVTDAGVRYLEQHVFRSPPPGGLE